MAEAFEYFRRPRHVRGTVNGQTDEKRKRRGGSPPDYRNKFRVEVARRGMFESHEREEKKERVLSFRTTFRYSVNRRRRKKKKKKKKKKQKKKKKGNRRDREFEVSRTEVRPPMQSRGWSYTCP